MGMNQKIRVCVIDDEPIACRKVQRLLKEDPEIEVVRVCRNGEEAREAIESLLPDLIFLDVQMPEMDGFEVLKSLKTEKLPYVIFVTAYDSYAIQAFRVHALDYLLKPFDKKEFLEALKRAKVQVHRDRERPGGVDLSRLLNELSGRPSFVERLVIKSYGKIFFLRVDEIDWIEAQGKYELIHAGKQTHLIREGMNKLEAELDPKKFVRIHKSTIVNVDCIEQLQPLFHSDFRAILRNGTALTISRRYREKLEQLLGRSL
jgi:two-component system, LytTR family, response regulator